MRHLSGFSQIASEYDGFVLDLWGVIHDGVNAFPHAVDCLFQLRERVVAARLAIVIREGLKRIKKVMKRRHRAFLLWK